MSDATLWGQAWAACLRVISAAPNLSLIVLLPLLGASTLWLLLYRPAPSLGALIAGGGDGDGDFAKGTPFWLARPPGERARLLAAPIAMGLLRLALAGGIATLVLATVAQRKSCAVAGALVMCGDTISAVAILILLLALPLVALAALRRFWLMGRRAKLTIVDTRGALGLHPWWIGELGLKAGEPMALRARRGFGKSKEICMRSDLDRTQIAVPPDMRAALDLEPGESELVLLPKEPFPVWPAIPVAVTCLVGFAIATQLMATPALQEPPPQTLEKSTSLQMCLTALEIEDIGKACSPLLDTPLDTKDKAFVALQIARMSGWMGDEEGALAGIDAALKADPALWQAHAQRAHIFADRRDYVHALSDLDAALKIAPDGPTFQQRAILLDNAGRMPNGILDFTRALELAGADKRGPLLAARAVSYLVTGQYDAALGDLQRAADYEVADQTHFLNSGRAHFLGGHAQEAIADLERASELDPGDAYAAIWLFLARQRAGQDGTQALRRAAKVLQEGSWQAVLAAAVTGDAAFESIEPGTYPNDDAPQLLGLQDKAQACELNFYMGEKFLGQGDKISAIVHFKAALDTGISEYIEYSAARNELIRLGAMP